MKPEVVLEVRCVSFGDMEDTSQKSVRNTGDVKKCSRDKLHFLEQATAKRKTLEHPNPLQINRTTTSNCTAKIGGIAPLNGRT